MTWARCECGCGWEGEDEVTQHLLEEAAHTTLDRARALSEHEQAEHAESAHRLRAAALRQISRAG